MKKWKRLAIVLPLPSLLLVASAATPAPAGRPESVNDSESIFAELRPDGSVRRALVVDWLRVVGHGRVRVEDVAPGADARALAGTPRARRVDDRMVWDVDVDGVRDLFVTATIRRELPIQVAIRYFVDSREVKPEEAQGAKGKVKVEASFRNRTDPFVPLVGNVTLSLPIASFRSLDEGDGQAINVGRTLLINYVIAPRPEKIVRYEIETRGARLPAMQVTLLPQGAQEAALAEALTKLKTAVEELRSGALAGLSSGASGLASGAALGSASAEQLAGALSALSSAAPAQQPSSLIAQDPLAAYLAQAVGTPQQPGDARQLASYLVGPHQEARSAVLAALEGVKAQIAGAISIPGIQQFTGPLDRLARGLAQVQASARELQAALARIDAEGFQDLIAELEAAGGQLGTPEQSRRAREYRTFTGMPEGATGEVRFVLRIAAPERGVAAAPAPSPERPRSLLDRLRELLPG